MVNVEEIIEKFLTKWDYYNNEHVLGCFFYGSYLTGYNRKNSDIDLHIVLDDSNPKDLKRCNDIIDGKRIEYFEKPISDLYLTVENEFNNQNNASLSILGTSKIIFDKTGALEKLQQYTRFVFSKPLPPLDDEEAKENVSILNNRMEKLENSYLKDDPYFYHLYHVTLDKIRKFYHRLNGMPEVQTAKVFDVYQDERYRASFYKSKIPEPEFIEMYLDAICDNTPDKESKLIKAQNLYNYSRRKVELGEVYKIKIKSRNERYKH